MSAALDYDVLHGNLGFEPVSGPTEIAQPLDVGHTPIFAALLEELNASPRGETDAEREFDNTVNVLVTSGLTSRSNTQKQITMDNGTRNTGELAFPIRVYPATYDAKAAESFSPAKVDPAMHGVWTDAPKHTTLHDRISVSGLSMAMAAHFDVKKEHPEDAVTQRFDMRQLLHEMAPAPDPTRAERARKLTAWAHGGTGVRDRVTTDELQHARTLVSAAITTELPPVPPLEAISAGVPSEVIAEKIRPQEMDVSVEQTPKVASLGEPVNRIKEAHQPGKIRRAITRVWGFVWKRRIPGLE